MTSRVRCSCGRIYDPSKHTICPDCGVESAVESVVVAEKSKPPAPPEIVQESARTGVAATGRHVQRGSDLLTQLKRVPWFVYAGVAGLALIIALALRAHHPEPDVDKAKKVKKGEVALQTPAQQESPSPAPSATIPTLIPSGGTTPPLILPSAVNLSELIANAAPGATVTVPAGMYPGGLVISRAIHIVGDPRAAGQVVIQSEGKECFSVRAKGVSIQNVQFWCKAIGDLPAVSVAEGADLTMDGCKIQSGSALGLLASGNSSIKAMGSGFMTEKGTAVRLAQQAQASFTQCSFSNARVGLWATDAVKGDLHSCAFEGIGSRESPTAIMAIVGANAQLTADDCQFTNNSVGINVNDRGSLTLSKCTFNNNNSSGGVVVLESGKVVVKKANLTNCSPYAFNVLGGGTLFLEDTLISGSRTAGVVIGDRNVPGSHADIKRSYFSRNAIGVGVHATGSAEMEASECNENNDGVVVFDPGSHAKLTKIKLISNRDHGICVYNGADLTATECTVENNPRGVQSGIQHKPAQAGAITLEQCVIRGSRIFGAGACSKSQLTLTRVTLENNGKNNLYRESGAIVQTDAGTAQASASPGASPGETDDETHRSTNQRKKARRPGEEAAAEALRRFLGRP